MKQRILVLGGEHFVARRVETSLSASHWATPVLFTGTAETLNEADLAGIDAVFNGTAGRPADIQAIAAALSAALARVGREIRVVHLSSMTVYGSFGGQATEATPLLADLGEYGAAQIDAEKSAAKHAYTVILRPGCEYGPHCPQWSERIARLLRAHRLGDLGTAGDGTCNLLFIDDLITAILAALRLRGIDGQVFNLAMRAPPTWNEYLIRFGRALGATPVSRIGARRLKLETKLVAPPLKLLDLAAQRFPALPPFVPPAITPSMAALCAQTIELDSSKAEELLKVIWMPLDVGLHQTAAAAHGRVGV